MAGLAAAGVCVVSGLIYISTSHDFWERFLAFYAMCVGFIVFILEVGHTRTLLHRVDSALPWFCVEARSSIVEETPFHPSVVRSLIYFAASLSFFTSFSILLWPGLHLLVAAALYLLDAVAQPVVEVPLHGVGSYANVDDGLPPGRGINRMVV